MSSVMGTLLLSIPLLGGVVALHIFLSLRKSRWPGLILPVTGLLIAVGKAFGPDGPDWRVGTLMSALIPVAVLLLAYLWCRERVRARGRREIDRMNAQDLR